jgi:hypothetical protein
VDIMRIHNPAPIVRAAEDRATHAALANRSHREGERLMAKGLVHFCTAGQALLRAKEQCAHGEWQAWLKANVHFSQQRASEYMRLAVGWSRLPPGGTFGLKEALAKLAGDDEPADAAEADAAVTGEAATTGDGAPSAPAPEATAPGRRPTGTTPAGPEADPEGEAEPERAKEVNHRKQFPASTLLDDLLKGGAPFVAYADAEWGRDYAKMLRGKQWEPGRVFSQYQVLEEFIAELTRVLDAMRDLVPAEVVNRTAASADGPADPEPAEAYVPPQPGEIKVQGKGVILAQEAINSLRRIRKNDALRERAFQIVEDWIRHQRAGGR